MVSRGSEYPGRNLEGIDGHGRSGAVTLLS